MRLPKDFVERKLSAALGARVTIHGLSVSLIGGSLDVSGVTVMAHGAIEPVLVVRRVKADVSVGAMLRKEIVVKSIVIEGPAVSIVRGADAAVNLPKGEAAQKAPTTTTNDEPDDDTPSAWKLAAEKVQVLDGSVHYRDGAYHVSAERIVGELLQKPDGVHVTVLAASLGRRDEPLDLGEARAHAVFRTGEIAKLATVALDGTFDVGDVLRGTVHSPAITSQRADVDIRAKIVLSLLRKLIPMRIAVPLRVEGDVEISAVGSYDPQSRWRASELSIRASDVSVQRDASNGA